MIHTVFDNYILNNIYYIRKELSEKDIGKLQEKALTILLDYNASIVDNIITTSHGLKQTENGYLLDYEMLIPVDCEIPDKNGFLFEQHRNLGCVVKLRYEGYLHNTEAFISEAVSFLAEKNISTMPPVYSSVTIHTPSKSHDISATVDFLIPIQYNCMRL